MTHITVEKIIYSVVFIATLMIALWALKRIAKKTRARFDMKNSRYFAMRRLLSVSAVLTCGFGLFMVWGLDFRNLWITISSVLALVAVGFIAMWSLLANILGGIILFFTSPFKIDDFIEIMPDEIAGQVIEINTFHTVLQDDELNYIKVPHTLFFQKYIKVRSKCSKHWGKEKDVIQ